MNKWETEPDGKAWEYGGYPCRIVRQSSGGHLCGYVGVSEGHPCYALDYSDEPEFLKPLLKTAEVHESPSFAVMLGALSGGIEARLDTVICVHGGVTYTNDIAPDDDAPKGAFWWIGFDCAHSGDLSPTYKGFLDGVYRDMEYVTKECEGLADQMKALADAVDGSSDGQDG